ncbi:hypothetical protein SAMN05216486_1095 [bacterium JGI 053]|nr:hypothetical protein SAMN05216486_1095 [bacterium JGI 053]
MTRAAFATLALCLSLAPRAMAQEAPRPTEVDSLAKVRVTQNFLNPVTLVGELTAADTADLVVLRGNERLIIPVAYIRHVELATGRRSSGQGALRGAIYGLLGGATATGLFVLASKAGGSDCADCIWNPSTGVVILGLPLTGASMLTGAAVGATRPGDYWLRVSLPLRLRDGR